MRAVGGTRWPTLAGRPFTRTQPRAIQDFGVGVGVAQGDGGDAVAVFVHHGAGHVDAVADDGAGQIGEAVAVDVALVAHFAVTQVKLKVAVDKGVIGAGEVAHEFGGGLAVGADGGDGVDEVGVFLDVNVEAGVLQAAVQTHAHCKEFFGAFVFIFPVVGVEKIANGVYDGFSFHGLK